MRHLRGPAVLLAALGLVLAGTAASTAMYATGYVALGDSYTSGVGSGHYLAESADCRRSALAYPELWASDHAPASYRSLACAGATTSDVLDTQLSALQSGTNLVSLTVGGNDVGFASIMRDCVLRGTDTCVSEIDAAETTARATLPGRLDHLYAQIAERAPTARVVVLGYPRFYDTGVWFCLGLSSTSRKKINEGADVLDAVIRAATLRQGFFFADVRARFAADHENCDGDSSWLHAVDFTDLEQSYHPTASGQSGGYYPAFSAAVTG